MLVCCYRVWRGQQQSGGSRTNQRLAAPAPTPAAASTTSAASGFAGCERGRDQCSTGLVTNQCGSRL
jgi:hypothetical protein